MAAMSIALAALLGFVEVNPSEGPVEAPPTLSQMLANAVEAPGPAPPSADMLRDTFRHLSIASRDRDIEPEYLVRPLCELYRDLDADEELSRGDREKMQIAVRSRLIDAGDRVFARLKRAYREERRESREPQFPSAGDSEQLAGALAGGREKEGEALIELIRTTIAPESWDVVGGPGSIYYYKPLKVMVIRQTSEVHWLIGGLRKALEK